MTTAAVQFASTADHILNLEEHLTDLVDTLVGLDHRLQLLEQQTLMEAGDGGDPLAQILARLDTFENRLDKLELRQRRPQPLTVVQNHRLDPDERQVFLELQRLFNKLDRELKQNERNAASRTSYYAGQFRKIRELNTRLDRCADQFCRMRERVAAIETRTADKGA